MTCSMMDSSLGHGTQKQWKLTGEDSIDSVQHRRHRFNEHNQRNEESSSKIKLGMVWSPDARETSHSGHTSSESQASGHIRFNEHNQRNDDHFGGEPSSKPSSHPDHTSLESHDSGHTWSPDSLIPPSSPEADAKEPLQNSCGMYNRFNKHNQRNEDHFGGGPSSKMNPYTVCSRDAWETSNPSHTSSGSPDCGHMWSQDFLGCPSSPITDVKVPQRNSCGMNNRPVWISRKKLVLDGPLHASSHARWYSQVFPSQHDDDKAANVKLPR